MDPQKLAESLAAHATWCADSTTGTRANLYGADLTGANLSRANLTRADLSGAKGILVIGPIGSRCGITYAVQHKDQVYILCGCFWGTIFEWEDACKETHPDNAHGKAYAAAAKFIRAYAAAYWAK